MKKILTRLALAVACWLMALGTGYAQHRPATAPAPAALAQRQRAEPLPPSTCSACFADSQARAQASGKKSAAATVTTNGAVGDAAAYVRSTNLPWGSFGDNTNREAMNAVFGAGNWDNLFMEQAAASTVFSAARQFVYLEGSDGGANALNAYLQANRRVVEGWVANGGRLFLNAAPNVGGNIDLGFGGITLTFSGDDYPYASGEAAVLSIEEGQGAFPPAGTAFTGGYFSHATVSGPGLTLILAGDAGTILGGKSWGSGSVLFGGMTPTGFHFPQPDAESLRRSCLTFVHPQSAPVLSVPSRITASNTTGNCGAAVSFAASATGAATLITYSVAGAAVTSPHVFPVGSTTVQVKATGAGGSVSTSSFVVTVNDVTAPTVATRNVTVTLVNGTATVSAAQVDNGSADACGLRSLALSRTGFTCANLGPNAVTLTATDAHGNVASAPAVVTVLGAIPTPSIAVTPTSSVFTGGVPANLYLGYGPASATLTALGGVSYAWSPATGLSSTTAANPVFTPTAAGTYAFTVTATNAFGCSATATVTLRVADVRCGNKNDKVLVCHNGHEICISPNAVPAHMAHLNGSDRLGSCSQPANGGNGGGAPALSATSEVLLEAYPNPFGASTTVRFRPAVTGAVRVRVYNAQNREVASLFNGIAQAEQEYSLALSAETLPAGVYLCRYESQGTVRTQRLAVVR